MNEKITRQDLSSLTLYYLSEFAKENNLKNENLFDLFLDCYNRDNEFFYQESYDEGKEAGYDEGYEEGFDRGQDEERFSQDDIEVAKRESYEDGYEKGYITGVNWKTPDYCIEKLKDI